VPALPDPYCLFYDKGSNYMPQICNHGSRMQWKLCNRLGECQGDWSRVGQDWQTQKRGSMDQEEQAHESRWQKLPTESCMVQVTYWRQMLEVSPDEDLRSEIETLIKQVCFLVV